MSIPRLTREAGQRYRLTTRADMDGLVCAVLLTELDLVDEIRFAHPKDMQDGKVDISERDVTANLPYNPKAFMVFDHHASERKRVPESFDNHLLDLSAPSSSRIIYNYFGGAKAFPGLNPDIIKAVDKADKAAFSKEDILKPEGWALLSFVLDARTGLGRFSNLPETTASLMHKLIEACRTQPIDAILALPEMKERIGLYKKHQGKHLEQLTRCTTLHDNLGLIDLRGEEIIYTGNRYLIYALYPQINVSAYLFWGKDRQNTVFALGKSILNPTSTTNIGELMLQYGGGGHVQAGTCQIANDDVRRVQAELITRITEKPE